MNTLMFSLGVAFVAVILISAVAVYAFVKVIEIKKAFDDYVQNQRQVVDEIYRNISANASDIWRAKDSLGSEVHDRISRMYEEMENRSKSTIHELTAMIDSRIDKLQNKQKQIK